MRPIKHVEKGLTLIAGGLFNTIQSVTSTSLILLLLQNGQISPF
jgi:hypothetical protein